MTAVVHGAISGRGRVSTVGQHICVRDPLKYTVVFWTIVIATRHDNMGSEPSLCKAILSSGTSMTTKWAT